jgi:beta-glucosidase
MAAVVPAAPAGGGSRRRTPSAAFVTTAAAAALAILLQLSSCSVAAAAGAEEEGGGPRYKDPTRPLNTRIDDLLRRMTLAEKIGQMSQIEREKATPDVIKNYFIGTSTP